MFIEKVTSNQITLIKLDTGTQLRLYKYANEFRVDYKGFHNSEETLCRTTEKETALNLYNLIKRQWVGNEPVEKIKL